VKGQVLILAAVLGLVLSSCGRGTGLTPSPTVAETGPPIVSRPAPSSLPSTPAGRMAFHSDPGGLDDLYVIDGDGSNLTQLTRGLETSVPPVWSPDGERIAFVCCLPSRQSIYLVDADGSGLRRLVSVPGEVGRPAWSPDSTGIAYSSYQEHRIYEIRADGSGAHVLVEDGTDPAWSPDGSLLAFLSDRDGDLEIYTQSASGTSPIQLTDNKAADYAPLWSPDGSRLAFVSERDGNPEIYVMKADGSDQTNLSASPDPDDFPAWSPDGARVAYVTYLDGADPYTIGAGNAEIFIASVHGSNRLNLTKDPVWDGDPAWSPDGRAIVFTRRAGHGELYAIDPDGSNLRHLQGLPGQANDCCAAWQP
jgi:Tol biopolymer transport system component